MKTYTYSFKPDKTYFVFCIETGETIAENFVTTKSAREFLHFNHLVK